MHHKLQPLNLSHSLHNPLPVFLRPPLSIHIPSNHNLILLHQIILFITDLQQLRFHGRYAFPAGIQISFQPQKIVSGGITLFSDASEFADILS